MQFILSRPDGSDNAAVNQEIRSCDEACIVSPLSTVLPGMEEESFLSNPERPEPSCVEKGTRLFPASASAFSSKNVYMIIG